MKNILSGVADGMVFFSMAAYALGLTPPSLTDTKLPALNGWQGGNEIDGSGLYCSVVSSPLSESLAPNPPYKQYTISQYEHGCDYGHAAVDMLAVGDKTIYSPINGAVTENTYDGLGNTVLVIENRQYIITMLHGDYEMRVGDKVGRGDRVGTEASHGNSSAPHTHLNIYDRTISQNVSPLSVMRSPDY